MNITLILCILLNVSVGIIFKIFGRKGIDSFQAVVVNYFTCAITASIAMGDVSYILELTNKDWLPYALAMGTLFFIVFIAIANSVNHHGVLITSAFQRLSLLAPVVVAILFFNEDVNAKIIIGIATTILTVVILNFEKNKKALNNDWTIFLPVLVWIGSCLVDLSLYLVERLNINEGEEMEFTATLFLSAGCFGLLVFLFQIFNNKMKVDSRSLLSGILLGVPNFFSIYLIVVLLNEGWNGAVLFPILNVSILLVSGLLGYLMFKETIDTKKIIGYILAIISIVLLS